MVIPLHEHRPSKHNADLMWTLAKRKKLLSMFGYFGKVEMAQRLGVTEDQLITMVHRMGGSYRVTKNPEDYIE